LIEYSDESIDFSDDTDVTEQEIKINKILWSIRANFLVEPEIKQWISKERIEINTLIPHLMKNFYETMKHIHKTPA